MSFSESDLLPISALQHLQFCERQCALIHVERVWLENRLTAEGRILHEKVHESGDENRPGIKVARGLHLKSIRLGLSGIADAVEYIGNGESLRIYPVEYKRGKPKIEDCDRIQLCAQAMALEEMMNSSIVSGALFYGQPRRREEVLFSQELRSETILLSEKQHGLIRSRKTPPAIYSKRCQSCSLFDICLPESAGARKSVSLYLTEVLNEKTA